MIARGDSRGPGTRTTGGQDRPLATPTLQTSVVPRLIRCDAADAGARRTPHGRDVERDVRR